MTPGVLMWRCGVLAVAMACATSVTLRGQSTGEKPKKVPIPASEIRMPPGMKPPESPRVPGTFEELFESRDKRAIDALSYLRCMRITLRAIQTGALGPVPRSWLLTCIEQGNEWRGVFSELMEAEPGGRIHRQFALRGNGMVVNDPVDTAAVLGVSRALLRGVSAPAPGKGKYEFLPVPLRQPTFIELWFLPVPSDPSRAVVGGDSLIQMSLDGTRELGHSRSAPPIRTLSVTPGATYQLRSIEERIPLLSELMVAHMALSVAPDVRILTRQYESFFTRSTTAVTHVQR